MRVLVDTNILARLSQPRHPLHQKVSSALDDGGHELRVVPQVLIEYWAIATRSSAENGLGLSMDDTMERLQRFKRLFPPLRDERGILERWEKLVIENAVRGKPTHDARIAAAMERHGLTHILTLNGKDFMRFPGICVISPDEVAHA